MEKTVERRMEWCFNEREIIDILVGFLANETPKDRDLVKVHTGSTIVSFKAFGDTGNYALVIERQEQETPNEKDD